MTTSVTLLKIIDTALPSLSGSAVTYNSQHNILLTQGYTSAVGNTYFQGIRMSDRIIVSFELGQGWYYLFLNGIRVYGYNGKEKRLIGSRDFYCTVFNETFAKNETIDIVQEYMKGQMKLMNLEINESQIRDFSRQLVDATAIQMQRLGA